MLDVVQMYLRDVVATVARPRWELKGFRRVSLEPGETKEVVFELTEKGLKLIEVYPGIDMEKDIIDRIPFPVLIDEALKKVKKK